MRVAVNITFLFFFIKYLYSFNFVTQTFALDILSAFVTASITCGDGTVGSLAADRAYRVTSAAYDNAIVLMHCFEGNSETMEALKTVIPELKMQGYEFVTLTELFTYDGGEVPQPGTGNIVLDKNKVK
jgi:peptidoglycan/xylan/chitin deacetylase (PgdA/CDA1 family)